MFTGFEILYIIICILFISLVVFQSSASSGISNLTNGNSGSSKSKRITTLIKSMAFIATLVFASTYYIAYNYKQQNNNTSFEAISDVGEDIKLIDHKLQNNKATNEIIKLQDKEEQNDK